MSLSWAPATVDSPWAPYLAVKGGRLPVSSSFTLLVLLFIGLLYVEVGWARLGPACSGDLS